MKRTEVEQQFRAAYLTMAPAAERLRASLAEQLASIVAARNLTLAVPMESRVKSLESLSEKLGRKGIKSLDDVDDLVGTRLIMLFREDVNRMDELVHKVFRVVSFEDTSTRLGDSTFGYQSNHYIVRLPDEWLRLPSYADLGDLRAEIQVRTLSQHMWAAASHKFQYKREESVPLPLRRTISRVSALLETVDLEFSRVLAERESYVETDAQDNDLNVETLARVLDQLFPAVNKHESEAYDELLKDLEGLRIMSASEFQRILRKHKQSALEKDRERAKDKLAENDPYATPEKLAAGAFYTHVGLARTALREHFVSLPIDDMWSGEPVLKSPASKSGRARKSAE